MVLNNISDLANRDSQPAEPLRNQFVLAPDAVDLPGWHRMELGERLCLSYHPHLNVFRAQCGDRFLTLLGFIFDWRKPALAPNEVIGRLLENATNLSDCIEGTEELCGRWILIYQDADNSSLFQDVSASRQVCFVSGREDGQLWCASQPDLLGSLAGLEPDAEAMAFHISYAQQNPEYWYPGDRLPAENARVLLANHKLDLATGRVQRYWPYAPREVLPDSEVSERVAFRLKGFMQAASMHFDLALGLSAGWDSRVVFASCHDIRNEIDIYSAKRHQMTRRHPDIAIPRALTRRLGLNHHLITQKAAASREFVENLQLHTSQPHAHFAPAMQAEYSYYQYKRVAVIGNISEVAKRPGGGWLAVLNARVNELSASGERISAEELADILEMGKSPFVIEAFNDWLAGIRDDNGYKISDLFYLEQGCGRRLSSTFIEFEFAWRDIFLPFNSRAILVNLMAAPEDGRQWPDYTLYVKIIQALWPNVLLEPVNPRQSGAPVAIRLGRLMVRYIRRLVRNT